MRNPDCALIFPKRGTHFAFQQDGYGVRFLFLGQGEAGALTFPGRGVCGWETGLPRKVAPQLLPTHPSTLRTSAEAGMLLGRVVCAPPGG